MFKSDSNFEDPLPSIQGNAGKLQQVFLNLFLNARDAMDRRRSARIYEPGREDAGARSRGGRQRSRHRARNIHRIYDPFFTTKGARKGTGLGLSVTYGIIQEHGGSIEVFNRREGGARFHLEFPWLTANARKPVNVA